MRTLLLLNKGEKSPFYLIMTEFEAFGESLSTHPDYLMMQRHYQEELLMYELQMMEELPKFVTPVSENRGNVIDRQEVKENEKNVLRGTVGSLRASRND